MYRAVRAPEKYPTFYGIQSTADSNTQYSIRYSDAILVVLVLGQYEVLVVITNARASTTEYEDAPYMYPMRHFNNGS